MSFYTFLPKLLNAISRNDCIDDIEIIISDDCSDEPFDDVLESFDNLNIQVIKNDKHYGFPKNGRQNGANAATGDWICFADQDDEYVDHAFDKMHEFITIHNLKNYVSSNFLMHTVGTDEYVIQGGDKGWTHGKFYEKSFWDEHDLRYDDVQYCEDINLTTKTGCIMITENIPMTILEEPLYIWNRRNDSLCEGDYFPKSMPDYIVGTMGVIIDYIERYRYDTDIAEQFCIKFIQTVYHVYFYFQSDILNKDRRIVLEAALVMLPFYERFKNVTGLTTDDIIHKTETDLIGLYAETRNSDCIQIPFTEKMTFAEWMKAYMN